MEIERDERIVQEIEDVLVQARAHGLPRRATALTIYDACAVHFSERDVQTAERSER